MNNDTILAIVAILSMVVIGIGFGIWCYKVYKIDNPPTSSSEEVYRRKIRELETISKNLVCACCYKRDYYKQGICERCMSLCMDDCKEKRTNER